MRRLFVSFAKVIGMMTGVLSLLYMQSCDIHEFPEYPGTADFVLELDFNTDLPLYKEIFYSMSRSSNNPKAYDVRHIVSVHKQFPDGSYSRDADTLITYICDDVFNLDCERTLSLEEGTYNFFVWTDFIDEGSRNDNFYNTSDFREIILKDKKNHIGSCDYRDAFRGSQVGTVNIRRDELTSFDNRVVVNMVRPLAKFKFISTDYDLFVEKVLRAEAEKKEQGLISRSVNPEDYNVIFRYTGFMPCSYNMFTDKPADSWTGVTFNGALTLLDSKEVELGFDYVFVNGSEAGVSVALEVYHKDGEFVASSPSIDVPLKRSKLTIVRGNFLTSTAKGGVGIMPDFDGEYNIEII